MVEVNIKHRQILPITGGGVSSVTPTASTTLIATSTTTFQRVSTSTITRISTSISTLTISTPTSIPGGSNTNLETPSTAPQSTLASLQIETSSDFVSHSSSATKASGTTTASATPIFAWSSLPTTVEACTAATFTWDYSGPQDTIQLLLLPATSPSLSAGAATNETTIATGVDAAALQWTWPQVNASVGQYVVVALGDGIGVPPPSLIITNGTDTSCLATAYSTLMPTIMTSGRREPSSAVLVGGIVGGVVGLVVAIGGFFAWKRPWRGQPEPRRWTSPSEMDHNGLASLLAARIPRLKKNGRHGPVLDEASHPPLIPNYRPPSYFVAEPRTLGPVYTPHRRAHSDRGAGGSSEDVSTSIIGSSFSTPSDTTSMTALMPTSPSTYLPSYATSLSTPPSYTPQAPHGVPRFPSDK